MNPVLNLKGDATVLLKELEAAIAECDELKKENEKLRSDLNSAVMHLIEKKRELAYKPCRPD